MEYLIKMYRKLKHNINYKDNYFRDLILILCGLLLLDLILLYLVW